jgi:hypothetical protein
MMRYFLGLALLSLIVLLAVPRGPVLAQTGFDRIGGDYTHFQVRSADPASCAARCERDNKCKAWSFSYPLPGVQGAVCWLKNQVPPRVENTCCVSGVRGAGVIEPRTGPTEFSIDRLGGDYRNFEVPADAKGAPCEAACQADGKCRSWTYVRPGYQGAPGRCFLKDKVKPPRRKPCCISGVVR